MCYTVHRSKQNQVRQGGYSDLITDNYGAILSSVLFFFFFALSFLPGCPEDFCYPSVRWPEQAPWLRYGAILRSVTRWGSSMAVRSLDVRHEGI